MPGRSHRRHWVELMLPCPQQQDRTSQSGAVGSISHQSYLEYLFDACSQRHV
ncbi:unnamed protein product [Penicillium roqueforti FM164]|uniref:Uncharacterized protein n=1 Tax=Penicillium roqueforti (strain FM164) TaxID=1365484 RepID=W6QKX8_PENRF|nr:unnamed protein product [Penicillium roqueforti FM164]